MRNDDDTMMMIGFGVLAIGGYFLLKNSGVKTVTALPAGSTAVQSAQSQQALTSLVTSGGGFLSTLFGPSRTTTAQITTAPAAGVSLGTPASTSVTTPISTADPFANVVSPIQTPVSSVNTSGTSGFWDNSGDGDDDFDDD